MYSGVNISGFELLDYNDLAVSNSIFYLSKTFLHSKARPSENPPLFEVCEDSLTERHLNEASHLIYDVHLFLQHKNRWH